MNHAMVNAREQDTSWVTKITLLNLGSPKAIPMAAQFCIPTTTPSYSLPHFLDYSSTCTVRILGLSSLDKFCADKHNDGIEPAVINPNGLEGEFPPRQEGQP